MILLYAFYFVNASFKQNFHNYSNEYSLTKPEYAYCVILVFIIRIFRFYGRAVGTKENMELLSFNSTYVSSSCR